MPVTVEKLELDELNELELSLELLELSLLELDIELELLELVDELDELELELVDELDAQLTSSAVTLKSSQASIVIGNEV